MTHVLLVQSGRAAQQLPLGEHKYSTWQFDEYRTRLVGATAHLSGVIVGPREGQRQCFPITTPSRHVDEVKRIISRENRRPAAVKQDA